MRAQITPQIEIALGTVFLMIGLAGPPLEGWRILIALALAAVVSRSGKFVGGVAMLATIAGGYAQHQELRVSLLVGGALVGIAAHGLHKRPRAATIIMAMSAVVGTAYLFVG
jgi:hypothetical protein